MLDSTRCDFYKRFKSLLNVESTLTLNIPFRQKRSLCRFRCSNHKLNIEYDRHFNVNREDRVCTHCSMHHDVLILEDEYYAFFVCEKFTEIREIYLFSWFEPNASREKFHRLFRSENPEEIKRLALYVTKLMECIEKLAHCLLLKR